MNCRLWSLSGTLPVSSLPTASDGRGIACVIRDALWIGGLTHRGVARRYKYRWDKTVKNASFMRRQHKFGKLVAAALSAMALSMPLAARAHNVTTTESLHEENLSAQSVAKHHYTSPAQRAEDDLLIVKTKVAIADAGLADNYPLTIDADHGVVTLAGVLASPADVQRAVSLVAGIDGVRGVNNRLTWEKQP